MIAQILDLIIVISMDVAGIYYFFFQREFAIGAILFACAAIVQLTILAAKYLEKNKLI